MCTEIFRKCQQILVELPNVKSHKKAILGLLDDEKRTKRKLSNNKQEICAVLFCEAPAIGFESYV